MRWITVLLAPLLWLALSSVAQAQSCPTTATMPGFSFGGNVIGRSASQWNTYFGAKTDANNGVLCNPTIVGGVIDESFFLGPALTSVVGTRNAGGQSVPSTATITPQLYPVLKSGNYTVNTDLGGASDTGAMLECVGTCTFTLPNPSTTTRGNSYHFGNDGTHSFTLTTVGGTANFAGCPGGIAPSQTFGAAAAAIVYDFGTSYACAASSTASTSANPTATAGPTAVNGAATTFMRSDAAPAIQKGSASQFGIVEADGTTITTSGGVMSVIAAPASGLTGATLASGVTASSLTSFGNSPTLVSPAITGGTIDNAAIGSITPSTGAFTTLKASSTVTLAGLTTFGSATAATGSAGEMAGTKISASGTAPGAGYAKFEWTAGTNGGTCKLIGYAGTSTTPVTIVDNIGAGC